MRNIITALCAFGLCTASVSALTINVTPGSLASKSAELFNTMDKSLELTGQADIRDLLALSDLSSSVETVDMSQLQIKGYSYPSGNFMGNAVFYENEIPAYVFAGAHFKKILFPQSLTKIGASAFMGSQLENVEFPTTLKEIGDYAFSNSDNLVNAYLNSGAKLGVGVFKDCDALLDVSMNTGILSIPDAMFDGCSSFMGEIPSAVTSIGNFAYRGTAIDEINLTHVKKIGDYSFAEMKNLSAIIFNLENPIELGKGAFFNDGALAELPVFKTDLEQTVFSHTSGSLKTNINSENIGPAAYANNMDIDTIFFGPDVKYIGAHAFRNNKALKLVNVEDVANVIDVDPEAFSGLLNDEGVYPIDLNVKEGTEDDWAANDVWRLFNIGHFVVGVDNIGDEINADIKIKKVGNGISVQSSHLIDYIGVFSVNGMTLHESKPGVSAMELSDIFDSDVIVVKVISGGISKILKLK